jgi:hypothetical protein
MLREPSLELALCVPFCPEISRLRDIDVRQSPHYLIAKPEIILKLHNREYPCLFHSIIDQVNAIDKYYGQIKGILADAPEILPDSMEIWCPYQEPSLLLYSRKALLHPRWEP